MARRRRAAGVAAVTGGALSLPACAGGGAGGVGGGVGGGRPDSINDTVLPESDARDKISQELGAVR